MMDFLTEKNLKDYLDYFGKTKKELLKTRLFFGIAFALLFAMFTFYLGHTIVTVVGTPLVFYLGYKYPYVQLINKKKRIDKTNAYLFPDFLQAFIALLPSSGNVYQTLRGTLEYTHDPLKTQLETLIEKIEESNEREHYLEFAEYVGTSEAYLIMDMIYQFSEQGIKREALEEIQRYIRELQENKMDEMITKKMTSIEFLGFTPIFISMFTVFGFAGVLIVYYVSDVLKAIQGL